MVSETNKMARWTYDSYSHSRLENGSFESLKFHFMNVIMKIMLREIDLEPQIVEDLLDDEYHFCPSCGKPFIPMKAFNRILRIAEEKPNLWKPFSKNDLLSLLKICPNCRRRVIVRDSVLLPSVELK